MIATGGDYITRFQWTAIEGAAWYHVFVATTDYKQIFHNRWYRAVEVCIEDICTTPVGIWLVGTGTFTWWMTHWNESIGADYINLYEESRFRITMPAPGTINGLAPTGAVETVAGTVELAWDAEPNTLWYQVWAGTADYTSTAYFEWLYVENICAEGTCRVTIPVDTGGAHEVWVRAWNPAGLSEWQRVLTFTITN
jgi:hypothetical protein